MAEGEVPAMRAGPGEFFLAAESAARGLVFFDDDADRFEVLDDPVDLGGGTCFATVRQISGDRAGREFAAQLYVGRRAR